MAAVNFNIRTLTNGAIFVQYQEDGKAKDAAFVNWADFLKWFMPIVGVNAAELIPASTPPPGKHYIAYTVMSDGSRIYEDDDTQ